MCVFVGVIQRHKPVGWSVLLKNSREGFAIQHRVCDLIVLRYRIDLRRQENAPQCLCLECKFPEIVILRCTAHSVVRKIFLLSSCIIVNLKVSLKSL